MGRPVSRLMLGTLYADEPRTWAGIADAFLAGGGDCFDTAFVYGQGRAEQAMGAWLHDRRVRDEVVLVGKGGHSPDCRPERLRCQLEVSLDRLGTDWMDVYMVHRDDPSVPAGEFVDAMDQFVSAGLVSVYGMSNWSMARLDEARAWADSHGRRGPAAVSNQLSLARPATEEVWPGAVSASGLAWEAWLRKTRLPLLAWSSQAEGFFATRSTSERATSRHALSTWHSPDNLERRQRALELAAGHGVNGNTRPEGPAASMSVPSRPTLSATTGVPSLWQKVHAIPQASVILTLRVRSRVTYTGTCPLLARRTLGCVGGRISSARRPSGVRSLTSRPSKAACRLDMTSPATEAVHDRPLSASPPGDVSGSVPVSAGRARLTRSVVPVHGSRPTDAAGRG